MASGSKKVIYMALVGNAGIAITKTIASFLTGSSAMLSEAIHSLVDTCNQLLLLWGIRQAAKPPDDRFPFGHGKEVYFWSFVVAIMIFAVGAGVSIYEGIKHLMHPGEMKDPTMNYIVLGIAMVFEGFAWYFAWREFHKQKGDMGYFEAVGQGKDPTTFVVLFEDSAAMAGLVVAAVGIALGQITGIAYFDGAASVVIGLILGIVAAWLAYETKGLLIGESASGQTQDAIRKIVNEQEEIDRINELLTMHMGPDNILVNISVEFNDSVKLDQIEGAITKLNTSIKFELPHVKRVFIEAESWKAHKKQADDATGAPGV